jgi:hypothetical protein
MSKFNSKTLNIRFQPHQIIFIPLVNISNGRRVFKTLQPHPAAERKKSSHKEEKIQKIKNLEFHHLPRSMSLK